MILAVPTYVNSIRSTFIDMMVIYRSETIAQASASVDAEGGKQPQTTTRANNLRFESRLRTCESLTFEHSFNAPHPMVEFTSLSYALNQALSPLSPALSLAIQLGQPSPPTANHVQPKLKTIPSTASD